MQQALQPSARAGRTGVVEFGLKRRQFGEQVIHRGMLLCGTSTGGAGEMFLHRSWARIAAMSKKPKQIALSATP